MANMGAICYRACKSGLFKEWNATLRTRALAEGIAGSYVALGNGQIVGYFSDREEACDASSGAIEKTLGYIGVSVIRQIPE